LHFEQCSTAGKIFRALPVTEQPVVADSLQPRGQRVKQEAADKFIGRERHDFLPAVIGVVLPPEAHVALLHIE